MSALVRTANASGPAALAQPGIADQRDHADRRYVVFSIGGENFGIGVEHVREVVNTPAIALIPSRGGVVEGIINLRGNVVPVINTARLLGMEERLPEEYGTVVVVESGKEVAGLLVEQVVAVTPLVPEPVPASGGVDDQAVQGVARLGDESLVLLMDLNHLLDKRGGGGGESEHK